MYTTRSALHRSTLQRPLTGLVAIATGAHLATVVDNAVAAAASEGL